VFALAGWYLLMAPTFPPPQTDSFTVDLNAPLVTDAAARSWSGFGSANGSAFIGKAEMTSDAAGQSKILEGWHSLDTSEWPTEPEVYNPLGGIDQILGGNARRGLGR
jgi:hypothetical protein